MRVPIKYFQACKISKTSLLCILSQKHSGWNMTRKRMIMELSIMVSETEETKEALPKNLIKIDPEMTTCHIKKSIAIGAEQKAPVELPTL